MKKIDLYFFLISFCIFLTACKYSDEDYEYYNYSTGYTISGSDKADICYGTGYTTAYTIRENDICYGTGYTTAYKIQGDYIEGGVNKICVGNSYYDVAYTIRENKICVGDSYYDVAYTIRENKIYVGNSYYDVAYTIRENKICVGDSYYDIAYTMRP